MIFLDVGAHEGQTLDEAIRYDFEHIYAFEPMPAAFARLTESFGDLGHVELINAGLAGESDTLPVYGSNEEMEASIYADKEDVDGEIVTECEFIEASEFLADKECAFVKLNCEGAEVPILDNLIDTGAIWKAESILVDFDVRRIPGMEDAEQEVLDRLAAIDFDRLIHCEDAVPCGRERRAEGTYRYSRADEIMCWLKSHGVAER